MYDIKWIRDNAEAFDKSRARRGLDPLAKTLLDLDDSRRAAITENVMAPASMPAMTIRQTPLGMTC